MDFVTIKFALIDCPPFAIAVGNKKLQPRNTWNSYGSGLGESSPGARFSNFKASCLNKNHLTFITPFSTIVIFLFIDMVSNGFKITVFVAAHVHCTTYTNV